MLVRLLLGVGVASILGSCGVLQRKPADQRVELLHLADQSYSAAQTSDVLDEVAGSWAYGDGIGHTSMKVGSWFVFPPYGVYLLGNSVLELAGYERLEITDVLPEEQEQGWDRIHDAVVSTPGRVVAALAGEEYRSKAEATRRIRRILHPEEGAFQDLELYLNEDLN